MQNEVIKKLTHCILNQIEDNLTFIRSEQFKRMCLDICESNISCTELSLFENSDNLLERLGWQKLAPERIDQFLSALCYFEDLVIDTNPDLNCENYTYTRNSLHIDIKYGHDIILNISKDNKNEC